MKVLITGGTGFIGTQLSLRCASDGYSVIALGQIRNDAEAHNQGLLEKAGVVVVTASVSDRALLAKRFEGVDSVFHLAAAQHEMNIPDSVFHEVNVQGVQNVIDAAVTAGVRSMVHASTVGVYGDPSGLIDEDSLCEPVNIYGKTKLEGERLIQRHFSKIPIIVIRVPEVYGPGDRRLLKMFRMINKGQFPIIGAGHNLHHLIYVDDLIRGMMEALSNPAAHGGTFLLAGPKPIDTNFMIATVANELGVRKAGVRVPLWPVLTIATLMELTLRPLGIQPPLHRRRLDFFRKSFSLSAERAHKTFGFQPAFSFSEGVSKTAAWYRNQSLL